MKGLLLKDFYMAKKYCKAYLFILVVFIGMSFVSSDNLFFVFYPCLLSGIMPVNLLGYDERFKWNEYSGTLPYTRAQIVSCKYLFGLFTQILIIIITVTAQIIRMCLSSGFILSEFLILAEILVIMTFCASSFCLPFMFKLGVEKGRIGYFVTVGIVCGGCGAAAGIFSTDMLTSVTLHTVLPVLSVISIAVFALSWYLSIVFYKRREM